MGQMTVIMVGLLGISLAVVCCLSCGKRSRTGGRTISSGPVTVLATDRHARAHDPRHCNADLFALVIQREPLATYSLFPNAEEITSGALNGSSAHRPLVRTSLNATALGALHDGTLRAGAKFATGVRSSSRRFEPTAALQ